jgi:hypothetical protein
MLLVYKLDSSFSRLQDLIECEELDMDCLQVIIELSCYRNEIRSPSLTLHAPTMECLPLPVISSKID